MYGINKIWASVGCHNTFNASRFTYIQRYKGHTFWHFQSEGKTIPESEVIQMGRDT